VAAKRKKALLDIRSMIGVGPSVAQWSARRELMKKNNTADDSGK